MAQVVVPLPKMMTCRTCGWHDMATFLDRYIPSKRHGMSLRHAYATT